MWPWLLLAALIIALFAWMLWVLNKRTPPRPGDPNNRKSDHNPYGGPPGGNVGI